ncbi:MAG TPA: isoprenylcysteine carboxylmethyltransferase family protein [Thermoanaerobaculia bacterium]|nr:isoprenylcysteine carboxylmethyltransferase family protein [Thermoanaerobaculia bacterium]
MNPMRVFLVVVILWVGSEFVLLFAKRSRSGDASQKDQGSVWVLWLVFTVCAFLAGTFQSVPETRMPALLRPWAFWTGLALIVVGFVLRLTAIFTLRRYFTVDVAIARDHKVIDTGLYGIVRHPSYTGSLVSFLGLGVAFANWVSLAIMIIGPALAIAYRIRIEERALLSALGDSYRAYAARTKRLIPGVF